MEQLIKKYKELPLPLKATVWFAVSQILQRGIGLMTTPFFTRLLSKEEYGYIGTFLSWSDVLIVLLTLSSWRGMMNLFAKDKEKNIVLSAVIKQSAIIFLFWCLIFALLQNRLSQMLSMSQLMLWMLLLYSFSQNIMFAWTIKNQYEYNYIPIVAVSLAYTALSAFGGLASVLLTSPTAEARLVPQVFSLFAIVLWIIVSHGFKVKVNADTLKEIWVFCLGFAVPLLPHYLSEIVLQSSDKIMISKLCGRSEVAVYTIAYTVGNLIQVIISSINSAFASYQYQKIKSGEYDVLAKNTNIIIAFIAFCLCLLMMFSREIVYIFGGAKYAESNALIIPIALGIFFNYVFQLFARVQEYYEQKHTIVFASVSCACLNILLNYVFIKKYGYSAAAYTTFFCYFTFCFLHYVFYKTVCVKNLKRGIYDVKSLALISAVLAAASVFIKITEDLYFIKYIILAAATVFAFIFKKHIINFAEQFRKE